MEQVTEGDLWRKGGSKTLWSVSDIAGGTALLHARDKTHAMQEDQVAVTSLIAGDEGWRRITVEGEMARYGVGRLAALRIIWSGEEEHEAAANAEYFEGKHTYSPQVERSKHLTPVLEQYAATLAPNEDALAYIVDQVLEREERDPTPLGHGTEDELRLRAVPDTAAEDAEVIRAQLGQDAEADQLVRELREFLGRGASVADTIANLQHARQWLAKYLPPAVQELARLFPRVMELLEAAEGQLDELHGPAVDAWYCGFCGNTVQDRHVQAILEGRPDAIKALAFLGLKEVHLGTRVGEPDQGPLPSCACHEAGMEMRHVVVRVTAASPMTNETVTA